jgi:hypothetical protein
MLSGEYSEKSGLVSGDWIPAEFCILKSLLPGKNIFIDEILWLPMTDFSGIMIVSY